MGDFFKLLINVKDKVGIKWRGDDWPRLPYPLHIARVRNSLMETLGKIGAIGKQMWKPVGTSSEMSCWLPSSLICVRLHYVFGSVDVSLYRKCCACCFVISFMEINFVHVVLWILFKKIIVVDAVMWILFINQWL